MHFRPELDHPEAAVLRHQTKEGRMHTVLSTLQLIVLFGALRMLMLSMGLAIVHLPIIDSALRSLLTTLFSPT